MRDPFDLQRFVSAQAPVYARVCAELRRGAKTSHWMWFIFPQLEGLGQSELSCRYALRSRAEALAYLDHGTLGPRLRECTELVSQIEGRSLLQVFGTPDDLKFCSSMTLFAQLERESQVFRTALERYCAGVLDPRTLALLR